MYTIIQKLTEIAEKYPKNKAVVDAKGWYSYERLETISDVLAQTIINRADEMGICIPELIVNSKSGIRIAVIFPRVKEYVVASIGTIKSGCVIVPIDPTYPTERIQNILEDGYCQLIVTTKDVLQDLRGRTENDFLTGLGYGDKQLIVMEDILEMSPKDAQVPVFDLSCNENEGIIIFTSGSTGKPKGVIQSQSAFTCCEGGYCVPGGVHSDNTWACMPSFTFLAHLTDIYRPLTVGGSVYIINEEELMDIRLLHDVLVKNKIDYMFMPPKLADTMLSTFDDLPMKAIICAGEKLRHKPKTDVLLIDIYASSEFGGALSRIVKDDDEDTLLGYLMEGCNGFLLDENGNRITEPNVVGEFCVTGPTLFLGYNNMPELTAEKFVECPFIKGERMIKSGDLMAMREDGAFMYHGRCDSMVKLNGYRVELGEVETVLSKHEKIDELACVLKKVNGGDNLCLYYATTDGNPIDEAELKEFGAKNLAHYMIPSIFVHMDKLPRNANGKLDRKNFPEPVKTVKDYVAPSTPTETKIQAIVADVLCLTPEEVSVTTELVSLGMNSLLTMQVIVEISDKMGLDISMKDMLSMGNIRMISDLIDSGALHESVSFKAHPVQKMYPATSGLTIYMNDELKYGKTLGFISIVRIEGAKMERMLPALKTFFDAHPSAKVKTKIVDGKYYMMRDDATEMPITTYKVDHEVDNLWVTKKCQRDSKVIDCDILGYTLIETPTYGYLGVVGSHACIDGYSDNLLISEFCTAMAGGKLTPEPYTIFDYALDEEAYYKSAQFAEDEQYYKDLIGDKVETVIPYDDDSEQEHSYGGFVYINLNRKAYDNYCKANGVQQNSLYAALYLQALAQITGNSYAMTSSLHNNRGAYGLQSIMNLTLRTYPIVTENIISLDDPDFADKMRSEIRLIQDQIARSMGFHFYEYYGSKGLGVKSPNFKQKSVFLYYVGMMSSLSEKGKEESSQQESNKLGYKVEFVRPAYENQNEFEVYDLLGSHMSEGDADNYLIDIIYNRCRYHAETIQKLIDIMQAYFNKLVNL